MKSFEHPHDDPFAQHEIVSHRVVTRHESAQRFAPLENAAAKAFNVAVSGAMPRMAPSEQQPVMQALRYRERVAEEAATASARADDYRSAALRQWRRVRFYVGPAGDSEVLLADITRARNLEAAADELETRLIKPILAEIAELEREVLAHLKTHARGPEPETPGKLKTAAQLAA